MSRPKPQQKVLYKTKNKTVSLKANYITLKTKHEKTYLIVDTEVGKFIINFDDIILLK